MVKDVSVSGNLAVAHVAYSISVTPKAGGMAADSKGNTIMVFRRESGHTWKIFYLIWSDESLVYPK